MRAGLGSIALVAVLGVCLSSYGFVRLRSFERQRYVEHLERGAEENRSSIQGRVDSELDVGGRQWSLVQTISPAFLARYGGQAHWVVLGAGLLLTSLLTAYLLSLGARSRQLEHLVALRTGELRRNEKRSRLVAESISDLVWEWDLETGQIEWFGDIDAALGFDPGGFPRTVEGWLEQIHPEDRERVRSVVREERETGWKIQVEYRILRADGSVRHWVDRGVREMSPAGSRQSVIGACVDVTEERRAQQESEARARLLEAVHRLQSGFIARKPDRELADSTLKMLLELTGSEFGFVAEVLRSSTGEPFLRTLAITEIGRNEESRRMVGEAAAEGFELRNLLSLFGTVVVSGERVIANHPAEDPRATGLPEGYPELDSFLGLPLSHGEELVGMVGLANREGGYDEEMAEALHPLLTTAAQILVAQRTEASRARLAKAVEQAVELILITDAEGRIEYVNPAFESITGYAAERVVGENPRLLQSGRHEPAFYRELWNTILGGEVWTGRLEDRKADGSLFVQEATISPIRGAEGKPTQYVLVGRDVTEKLRIEEHLRHGQKMEAIGQLAGGIAHDFSNLLMGIFSCTDLALDEISTTQESQVGEYLRIIRGAAEQGGNLTRQLQAFARGQMLEPEEIDLDELVGSLGQLAESMLGARVQLRIEPDGELRMVRADRGQIEQVLMNLVVNAGQAMPEGGRLTIRTGNVSRLHGGAHENVPAAGDSVAIWVEDTGIGMDRDTLARIFEPFYTTREMGSGLGLASVHGIVSQHGGEITVESEPGQGTSFQILLPASDGRLEASPERESIEPVGGGETILLAEDNAIVRSSTAEILGKAGYSVVQAEDGEEAVRLFEIHGRDIDLVLMDVVMPKIGGHDAAREILSMRPDTPCLFSSGYDPDPSVTSGEIPLLHKPYSREDLLRRIRDLLDSA